MTTQPAPIATTDHPADHATDRAETPEPSTRAPAAPTPADPGTGGTGAVAATAADPGTGGTGAGGADAAGTRAGGPDAAGGEAGGPDAAGVEAGGPDAAGGEAAGSDPAGTDGAMPSLSPSRAADFKICPLLYRFRTIDRLPELPTPDQARGTLVHAVLERLFDLPAAARTPQAATALVAPQWRRLTEEAPELATLLAEDQTDEFLASTRPLLEGYFAVEDPRRLEPRERESLIEAVVGDRAEAGAAAGADRPPLRLRGYVDRLDVAPTGELRVVDYKTGGAPREAFEARALFQLKFYALVLWRTRGRVPRVLRLLYLRDAEVCDYTPEADELIRFERTLFALWRAIEAATAARDFRPKPSRLCGWCSHQARCPAFGGTPPPFPEAAPDAVPPPPDPRPGADD